MIKFIFYNHIDSDIDFSKPNSNTNSDNALILTVILTIGYAAYA